MQDIVKINGMRLSDIIRYYFEDRIWVDRKYQRKLVWDMADKKLFIKSLIEGIPVPAVIYAESKDASGDKQFNIIDGLQRTNAIVSFLSGEFSIEYEGEERYFNLHECHYTNKALRDNKLHQEQPVLESQFCFDLAGLEIPVIIIPQDDKQIEKIFKRINSTGKKLSPQDIRQSTSCNRMSELVKDLAASIRGDLTYDNLINLSDMPKISFGYGLKVEDTFWVKHRIFEGHRLRDSKDEEIIAKILSAILLGKNEPSIDVLDSLYDESTTNGQDILNKISDYGEGNQLLEDLCIVSKTVTALFDSGKIECDKTLWLTNEKRFRIIFQAIFQAYCYGYDLKEIEMIPDEINDKIKLINFDKLGSEEWNSAVQIVLSSMESGISLSNDERCKIDLPIRLAENPYEAQMTEFKIGFTKIGCSRPYIGETANYTVERIAKTISAMSNTKMNTRDGYIVVGISDNKEQAEEWEKSYNSKAVKYGNHYIVGVEEEINRCFANADAYLDFVINELGKCNIDRELLQYVEQNIEFTTFKGKKILLIPSLKLDREVFYNSEIWIRKGSSNKLK